MFILEWLYKLYSRLRQVTHSTMTFFIHRFVALEADKFCCHSCFRCYYHQVCSSWPNYSSLNPAYHLCKPSETRIFHQDYLLEKHSLSLLACSSLDWWLPAWLTAVILGSFWGKFWPLFDIGHVRPEGLWFAVWTSTHVSLSKWNW